MNLIQVQEHLKDMPMRAIMEYANGKNPQVPPYLALGELNRRKQMEQSAKTGTPPDGTVKDKLEKELTGQAADLMQAGAAKQAQSNQQLQQSLMGQPQPVPEGTPQPPQPEEPMPEMQQMAAGGLTSLPTRDMFKFAGGGGVVAFADEGLVQDPMGTGASEIMSQERGTDNRNIIERLLNAPEEPEWKRLLREKREAAEKAQQNPAKAPAAAPEAAPVAAKPDASMMAPPPQATGAGLPSLRIPKAPSFEAPDTDAYNKGLAAFKQANPGAAGSEFQKLLDKIAKQDEEDRGKFLTQEKGRTRADFWKALIDAGEATRGQKGLGALLGGFGKSAGSSQAEADERANAQTKMRREQDLGMAKMRAELESARRAEARGDFEAAFKHKQDAEKIGRDLQQAAFSNQMESAKLQETANYHGAHIASLNRDPELVKIARSIHKPGMPWEEALDRAAHYARGAQYETVAQREKQALMKDLSAKTNLIDMQMVNVDPNSSDYKKMLAQRQRLIDQFMADQKMLGGKLGQNAPAVPIKGTVERLG